MIISESISQIDEFLAFRECYNLESIDVSQNNVKYASSNGVLFNKKKTKLLAYPSGKTSKAYTVPKTVKAIGVAFSGCNNLKSIKIPKSVKLIVREDEFRNFEECYIKNVYYSGSKTDWANINKQYVTLGKTVTKPYGKNELKNVLNGAKINYNAKF
ncbi:MAG: leucine-rich repeat protein [Eubacterium sp.]